MAFYIQPTYFMVLLFWPFNVNFLVGWVLGLFDFFCLLVIVRPCNRFLFFRITVELSELFMLTRKNS